MELVDPHIKENAYPTTEKEYT